MLTFHRNNARWEERQFVDDLHDVFCASTDGTNFLTLFRAFLLARGERQHVIQQHVYKPHASMLRKTWDEHPMQADDTKAFYRRLNCCFGSSVPDGTTPGVWTLMFETLELPCLLRFYCRNVMNRPYAYLQCRCRRYRAWHRLYCMAKLKMIQTWHDKKKTSTTLVEQMMHNLRLIPRQPSSNATNGRRKFKKKEHATDRD